MDSHRINASKQINSHTANKERERRIMMSLLILLWLPLLFSHVAAKVHHHEFVVHAMPVKRLCKTHNIITVNGQFPGPTLEVTTGDKLVIKVVNRARYNATIHWHGVRQLRTGWADGPEFITQCPIRPGGSYTYRFTITEQEGTLWWHAHSSWLRATVYGALIVYPKEKAYPFPKPHRETPPILLGEWWNENPIDVVKEALRTGGAPKTSNAFTINGQPGDLYNCSAKGTTIVPVASRQTNLLRFINSAMNTELFVSIAGHTMTVVGADAAYTKPYATSVILLGPGQTTDVLVTSNQTPGRYYIAARAYAPAQGVPFDNTTTTAILHYINHGAINIPSKPFLPAFNDTATAASFAAGIKSPAAPVLKNLPRGPVDENLFFTIGFGLLNCSDHHHHHHHHTRLGYNCQGPNNNTRFAASENNVSFVLPATSKSSILQAHYYYTSNLHGAVFTSDFPALPPKEFDYTAKNVSRNLWQPIKATKALTIRYGSVVQIVLQDTNIFAADSHPMHLHGYQFYILATGTGNFDPVTDTEKFNLVDPPERNTVGVPVNGWAVIRFRADNPGAWLLHCHLDIHLAWGLATVLIVEDGAGEMQSLQPPPNDLPKC